MKEMIRINKESTATVTFSRLGTKTRYYTVPFRCRMLSQEVEISLLHFLLVAWSSTYGSLLTCPSYGKML
jgi:hypothetical protein